ncbi:hypothetical protein V6N12_020156 [Hibiscus sabdariffa]|uniref:Homeobox domain-containing protein n=1 Tax=Hibiscus sabdariffa TaxID=183260 RepID=A0ABR1ZL62_9ROSI
MVEFAEKLGWRIQKQDEQELQQFCAQVGVKRQVFKVWMHNNKQAMKKKQMSSNGFKYSTLAYINSRVRRGILSGVEFLLLMIWLKERRKDKSAASCMLQQHLEASS